MARHGREHVYLLEVEIRVTLSNEVFRGFLKSDHISISIGRRRGAPPLAKKLGFHHTSDAVNGSLFLDPQGIDRSHIPRQRKHNE